YVDEGDFGGAAANVEEHDAPRIALDERAAARYGKARLGLPVDDLEPETRLSFHPRKEVGSVDGRPAGFGGDQPGTEQRPRPDLVRADLQCFYAAAHRRIAQPPRSGQPLAETNDAGERVDDAELAGAGRYRDEQPAVVGPQIQRGEDRRLAVPDPSHPA